MKNLYNLISLVDTKAKDVSDFLINDEERKIFDAIIANLLDINNPLRINNFSYAIRELIRIHLENYFVSSKEVEEAWWFDESIHLHSGNLTRKAKILYAIIKNYNKNYLYVGVFKKAERISSELIKNIDKLNKYTHFNELDMRDYNNENAKEIFEIFYIFLYEIKENIKIVQSNIESSVEHELFNISFEQYFDPSELGATHGGLEDLSVETFELVDFSYPKMVLRAHGTIFFHLQWGSNSDVRTGWGACGSTSLPFTFDFTVSLIEGKIIEHEDLEVDYDYGNKKIIIYEDNEN